jgi:hypothetical protein
MNQLTHWLHHTLYPLVFDRADSVFSEHHFTFRGRCWQSPTYLDGNSHTRKDKTIICRNYPGQILEQGGESLSLIDYIIKRDSCSFIEAVRWLSGAVGEQVPGDSNGINTVAQNPKQPKFKKPPTPTPVQVTHIPQKVLNKLADSRRYGSNSLLYFLANDALHPFANDVLQEVAQVYHIGTITRGRYACSTTFPFVDVNDNCWAVQVKKFNQYGHTCANSTTFLHSLLQYEYRHKPNVPCWLQNYLKSKEAHGAVNCFFGEHLLSQYPQRPVWLFEAPKTALIAALYNWPIQSESAPLCLAVGAKGYLNERKLQVLKRKEVVFWPDASTDGHTYSFWVNAVKKALPTIADTEITFSQLLEQEATDTQKAKGIDVADWLLLEPHNFAPADQQPAA